MKRTMIFIAVLLLLAAITPVMAGPPGKGLGKGWEQYVTVKVDWNGNPGQMADWNVYAGPHYVELHGGTKGDFVTGCSACLDMSSYVFVFTGNNHTLQFNETYVSGVEAHPQTHHVVLHFNGTAYVGSITARYDFPGSAAGVVRMDIVQYTIVVSGGSVTSFHYDEVEYVQPKA